MEFVEALYRTHRPWLRKTAKNRYIDLVRRAKNQPDPEQETLSQDDHTQPLVAALCAPLPEEERTVFILRYFEGYNAAEVGELLDLNPSTVRSRLASARRKLKQMYETS